MKGSQGVIKLSHLQAPALPTHPPDCPIPLNQEMTIEHLLALTTAIHMIKIYAWYINVGMLDIH